MSIEVGGILGRGSPVCYYMPPCILTLVGSDAYMKVFPSSSSPVINGSRPPINNKELNSVSFPKRRQQQIHFSVLLTPTEALYTTIHYYSYSSAAHTFVFFSTQLSASITTSCLDLQTSSLILLWNKKKKIKTFLTALLQHIHSLINWQDPVALIPHD